MSEKKRELEELLADIERDLHNIALQLQYLNRVHVAKTNSLFIAEHPPELEL